MEKYFPKGLDLKNEMTKQIYSQMYPMMRKRNCDCGYDTDKKNQTSDRKCPINLALSNHISFPSLKLLPCIEDTGMYKGLYYSNGSLPKKHWCLLVELHENFRNKCWSGFTIFGEKVTLNLAHTEDDEEEEDEDENDDCKLCHLSLSDKDDDEDKDKEPVTFKWSDLKQGNTVAILYAEKKDNFVFESYFESEYDKTTVYVFKSGFLDLFEEAKNLLNDADTVAKGEKSSCFGCGAVCEKISRCASCKLAKYCSVECQRKCWKESHKKLCPQNEMILRLAALPRHEFKKHFTFETSEDKSLPAYIYKPEFFNDASKKTNSKVAGAAVDIKPTSDTKCGLCGETNQKVFLSKGKPLTKTRCCSNWICDDQHTYVINSFARNSCHRNHDRYTICATHFHEEHSGKWQNCHVCKQGMSKVDYIDKCTNKYNFLKEKLDIKNRPTITCHNCGYKADDLDLFAGKVIRKSGQEEIYCKKGECKKKGDFNGPSDSFLVTMMMR